MKFSFSRIFGMLLLSSFLFSCSYAIAAKTPKKIYMSFILHGNMNYDRYVRPTIWQEFPVIYNNLLDFIEEHPDFKGQVQFSGQTFKSLQQTAPHVIEHAMKLHERGQLNFTGTFYSEPVNVSMDGETNFRCARLGTSIIADEVGSTDGFYLQERAYHPQLPWILNHSDVSWVPVNPGEDTFYPFKLKGMDGSVTICVPSSSRKSILDNIINGPENGLIIVEEDYEIPQTFTKMYKEITSLDKEHEDIIVEWITVKEYISKFGVKEERYVDHTAKTKDINRGTYSRWTSDPLDIIVQNYTNHAMSDFRAATIMNSLSNFLFNNKIDESFSSSNISLKHDPLTWNIEHASTYPDIEPKYLSRDGEVTIISKAEHLLVWAVNSDSRGWYPLYERRRERINSFENSSALSNEIINRGIDAISQNIQVEGYDRYFIIFNAEQERNKVIKLDTERPYDIYDYSNKEKLRSTIVSTGTSYNTEFELRLPAYGYKVIGLLNSNDSKKYPWTEGTTIENDDLKISAQENKIVIEGAGSNIELSLDSFKIKALAEVSKGKGDDIWRNAKAYGKARITSREALYPQLRIEHQIDWLIHMQQTFTLLSDRVICDMNFTCPHPTLIRKSSEFKGWVRGTTFNPEGLKLQFKTYKKGKVLYDIPFGISPHKMEGLSYLCMLRTGIFQFDTGGGFVVATGTGEQALYTIPEEGELGLYLGASTTSGPIRDVGLTIKEKTNVRHEDAWYSEPFHGTYNHKLMVYPFNGNWQEKHAPTVSRSYTEKAYVREFYPVQGSGDLPTVKSLITVDHPGVEITSMDMLDNKLTLRLNDREGKDSDIKISIGKKNKKVHVPANGIIDVEL